MLCYVGHLLLLCQHLNLHLLLFWQLHEVVEHVFLRASLMSAPFIHIFSNSATYASIVKVLPLDRPITAVLLRTQISEVSIASKGIGRAKVVIQFVR